MSMLFPRALLVAALLLPDLSRVAQAQAPAPALPVQRTQPPLSPTTPGVLPPIGGAPAQPQTAPIVLEVGAGRLLRLSAAAASLFAADPRVAEVRPASPDTVFVFGIAPGRTTIAATSAGGAPIAEFQVVVRASGFSRGEIEGQLRRLLPNARVRVDMLPSGVLLTGDAATPIEAEQAGAIARGYAGEGMEVVNRIGVRGATQVNLRVRVAEMSREVTRELGFNWSAVGQVGRFAFGLLTGRGAVGALLPPFFGPGGSPTPDRIGGGYSSGGWDINGVVDALARDNLITVLAEPNLTAQSGEVASFLAGGEFPIPVAQRDNQVTIEFKQFGVSLAFVPTVLSAERISLRVRPEVSELSDSGAIQVNNLRIPALAVRRAETTVELGSGQSFAIAGLFQDSTRIGGQGLPGLSEVPVLGALFRSDRFRRNETELVIIITPYLVRPVSEVRALALPTDGYRPPSEIERIFHFRQRAGGPAAPRRIPGEAGFIIE
jgi:pilus assembly protein CpaC